MKMYPILSVTISSIFLLACSEQTPVQQNHKNIKSSVRPAIININATPFDQGIFDELNAQQFGWGGMMYDKWWTADTEGTLNDAIVPTADNQTWASTGNTTYTGSSTWRCKSCHGWDYIGRDGAYSDPAHKYYTGFPGITQSPSYTPQTAGDPAATFAMIDTGTLPDGRVIVDHDFGTYITDPVALHALTLFVERMRMDAAAPYPGSDIPGTPAMVISNLPTLANEMEGHEHYHLPTPKSAGVPQTAQGGCHEGCHGGDGTAIVFNGGDPAQPTNLKELAFDNPAEVLHKVRFGNPGTTPHMPGLEWYENPNIIEDTSLVVATNILGFVRDGLMVDHAKGGRLYDNWVLETNMPPPAETNPLLAIRDPNPADIPADKQWLCSSCHGYDYAGVEGFQNNLIDLTKVRDWNIEYLYNYLKNGRPAFIAGAPVSNVHNFGAILNDSELWNLSEFLLKGIADTRGFISLGLGGRALGEGLGLHGEDIYMGTMGGVLSAHEPWACVDCHSDTGNGAGAGTTIATPPGKNIFEASWSDNKAPWRTFHRIRFGMPGLYDLDGDGTAAERMPGFTEIILDSPIDPGTPRDPKETLTILTHRSMDLLTFSQDMLMTSSPAKVNQVRTLIINNAP